MRAYLLVTGSLLALLHLWRTVAEWSRLGDPAVLVEGPGIGAIAAGLSVWAWRLRPAARP